METIAKRLKKFFEDRGISIASVEQKLGLSSDSLGKALRNDKNFNAEILPKIVDKYDISPVWILTGRGEPLQSSVQANQPVKESSLEDNTKPMASFLKEQMLRMENLHAEVVKTKDQMIEAQQRHIDCLERQIKSTT